jgi:hypothetical protein
MVSDDDCEKSEVMKRRKKYGSTITEEWTKENYDTLSRDIRY